MEILLIGADGQLGSDLQKAIDKTKIIPLTIADLDITDKGQVARVMAKYEPKVVINTAAFHNTDACEEQIEKAFLVNTVGVKYLADACKNINSTLVHISTDYVFDGKGQKPYTEDDLAVPISVYGISKLAGEQCIKYTLKQYFIIRTAGLYGAAGCMGKGGKNFVESILARAKQGDQLKVVDDEIVTPTHTLDLANKINQLIKTIHYGTYHITNHGECSWYDFAKKIFELTNIKVNLAAAKGAEFQSKIERPKYSVLKNQNLVKLGMDDLRPWDQALEAYLKEKGHI